VERKQPLERTKASDFPQELLNLFDGYVHGGISRRAFLDGAQKFAVGGLTGTLPPRFRSTEAIRARPTLPRSRRQSTRNAQYGELDTRVTSGWPAFDAALNEAGVPHEGGTSTKAQATASTTTRPRATTKPPPRKPGSTRSIGSTNTSARNRRPPAVIP